MLFARMRCVLRFLCVLVIGLIAGAPAAHAQPSAGEAGAARVRIGPLSLKPTFAITNLGVDGNVFNEADVEHPRQDFTITATPKTDWWLRAGRSTVNGSVKDDFGVLPDLQQRAVDQFGLPGGRDRSAAASLSRVQLARLLLLKSEVY
jgi:hypothetical protein